METWRDIPGYEGKYMASDKGAIKSHYTGKVVRQYFNVKKEYWYVKLRRDSKKCHKQVHVLVLKAFRLPPDYNDPVVIHLDGNINNNRLLNLAWTTRKRLFDRRLRAKEGKVPSIEKRKPIEQLNAATDEIIANFESIREAARMTEIDYKAIGACCRGVNKTSGGYKWRFA